MLELNLQGQLLEGEINGEIKGKKRWVEGNYTNERKGKIRL